MRRALVYCGRVRHRLTISSRRHDATRLYSFGRGTVHDRETIVSLLIDYLEGLLDAVSRQLVCCSWLQERIVPILHDATTSAHHVSRC